MQEALTNTLKHGGPDTTAEATIAADSATGTVHLRVTDTGHPPPRSRPDTGTTHHGIIGIRERASLYDGTVTIGPAPSATAGSSTW